jgi:hypothetical protein
LLDIIVSDEYLHALLLLRIVGANSRSFPRGAHHAAKRGSSSKIGPVEIEDLGRKSRVRCKVPRFARRESHL